MFCVQCGGPLRQQCPYGCGEKLLVVAPALAPASCPKCHGPLAIGRRGRAYRTGETTDEPVEAKLIDWPTHEGAGRRRSVRLRTPGGRPSEMRQAAATHIPVFGNQRVVGCARVMGRTLVASSDRLYIWDEKEPRNGQAVKFVEIRCPSGQTFIGPLVASGTTAFITTSGGVAQIDVLNGSQPKMVYQGHISDLVPLLDDSAAVCGEDGDVILIGNDRNVSHYPTRGQKLFRGATRLLSDDGSLYATDQSKVVHRLIPNSSRLTNPLPDQKRPVIAGQYLLQRNEAGDVEVLDLERNGNRVFCYSIPSDGQNMAVFPREGQDPFLFVAVGGTPSGFLTLRGGKAETRPANDGSEFAALLGIERPMPDGGQSRLMVVARKSNNHQNRLEAVVPGGTLPGNISLPANLQHVRLLGIEDGFVAVIQTNTDILLYRFQIL